MTEEKTGPGSELTERAKKYRNSSDGRFSAAIEIAMEGVDHKLDPLLKRLEAIENGIPARQAAPTVREETFANVNIEKFIDGLHEYLSKEMKPLFERLAALEKEVEEVKIGGFKYSGVHQRAIRYKTGNVVTHSGNAWVAVTDAPKESPGDGPGWQLLVKGTTR
jgi:hypothetical protein